MISAAKNKLALIASLLLVSCAGSRYGGKADASSFVDLAPLSQVNVATCYLKTKTGTTSAIVNGSSAVSSSSAASEDVASAHEVDFFSSDDYYYSTGSVKIAGHSDKNGLYFLINPSKLVAYLFEEETPLDSHRAVAESLLKTDYDYLSSVYSSIRNYASQDADSLGFDSVSVLYTDISDTVGYNATTVKTVGDVKTQIDYYLTLDEVSGGGYAFTDAIIRSSVTNDATDTITYQTSEYNFSLVADYSSTNYVFNASNYAIIMASGGLDSLNFNGLIGQ